MQLKTLEDYPSLNERISLKREMIEVLESARESTTQIIDGMPRGNTHSRDKMLNYTAKLMEWAERLNDDILQHAEIRKEVDAWLAILDRDSRSLIRAMYIDKGEKERVTMALAARRANMSERTAYRIMDRLEERGLLSKGGTK